jgi:hypothetical protein
MFPLSWYDTNSGTPNSAGIAFSNTFEWSF